MDYKNHFAHNHFAEHIPVELIKDGSLWNVN